MNPMGTVLMVTAGLLAVSGLLVLVRLFRGPTRFDRLVALDMLLVVMVAAIAVDAALRGAGVNVVLLVVIALVGFLSTVGAARLLGSDR